MAKILVTGANGQLGNEFRCLAAAYPQHQFHLVDKNELNIADGEMVRNFFSSFGPQFCINCAAYTAVDKAEKEAEQAFTVNATAVGYLASACAIYGSKFIHLSTDYVFDGTATQPYKEADAVNPASVYGRSKLQGEEEAMKNAPASLIIRTSWVYSTYGNNFVKTMLRLMQSKSEINVVADQWGTPTYAADLAEAILQIIERNNWQPGIYHYSNEGETTWFHFAQAIKEIIQSPCIIHPITTEHYPTPAQRPKYSVLNKEKIRKTFGLTLPPWQQSLQTCLRLMNA
jgi:dTDP-4-dehydrorhamnose reductase